MWPIKVELFLIPPEIRTRWWSCRPSQPSTGSSRSTWPCPVTSCCWWWATAVAERGSTANNNDQSTHFCFFIPTRTSTVTWPPARWWDTWEDDGTRTRNVSGVFCSEWGKKETKNGLVSLCSVCSVLTVLRAFPCRTRLADRDAASAVEEEVTNTE